MYAVSDALKQRLLGSHARRARVTILDSALRPVPGGSVSADTVVGGSVFVTSGSGARRTADVTLNNTNGIYTPANPGDLFYWNRIVRIEQGVLIEAGDESSAEWVPLGTFMIDRPSVSITKGGITMLAVKMRDRWKMIDKAELPGPGGALAGAGVQTVIKALANACGIPNDQIVLGGTPHTLGADRWYNEGDKYGDIITELANAFGLRVYFDVNGYFIVEDQPAVTSMPVAHHFKPGSDSIVTEIKRDLTDERFANHVVVASASSDPDATIIRAEAADERDGSPTSINEIGRFTLRYASPMITDATIAQSVADRMLERSLRFSEETEIKSISLPYLDTDDRVFLSHPDAALSSAPYLVESITMPVLGAEASLRLTAAHDLT